MKTQEVVPLKLPREVRKNGKIYKQVKRVGDVALFDAFMMAGEKGDKKLTRTSREVFFVKIQKETVAPNGKLIPLKEKYPSNEDFGKSAWSYSSVGDAAEKMFDELVAGRQSTKTGTTTSEVVNTKQKSSRGSSDTKKIELDEHVVIRKFVNGTVMVSVDKRPVGPKQYLVRAAVELKKIPKAKAEEMKIKQLLQVIFE